MDRAVVGAISSIDRAIASVSRSRMVATTTAALAKATALLATTRVRANTIDNQVRARAIDSSRAPIRVTSLRTRSMRRSILLTPKVGVESTEPTTIAIAASSTEAATEVGVEVALLVLIVEPSKLLRNWELAHSTDWESWQGLRWVLMNTAEAVWLHALRPYSTEVGVPLVLVPFLSAVLGVRTVSHGLSVLLGVNWRTSEAEGRVGMAEADGVCRTTVGAERVDQGLVGRRVRSSVWPRVVNLDAVVAATLGQGAVEQLHAVQSIGRKVEGRSLVLRALVELVVLLVDHSTRRPIELASLTKVIVATLSSKAVGARASIVLNLRGADQRSAGVHHIRILADRSALFKRIELGHAFDGDRNSLGNWQVEWRRAGVKPINVRGLITRLEKRLIGFLLVLPGRGSRTPNAFGTRHLAVDLRFNDKLAIEPVRAVLERVSLIVAEQTKKDKPRS